MNINDSTAAGRPMSAPGAGRRRGPGRPRAGSENKRERILDEAVTLFGAHGYSGTSLAEVAEASDISKAGLLHHFSSKEELFARVLERCDQEGRDGLERMSESEDPWDLLEDLVDLTHYVIAHRNLAAIHVATMVSVLDAEHPGHRWLTARLTGMVSMIENALERGKEAGTVRPDAPSRLIARSVAALCDGMRVQWLCSTTPGSAADEHLATSMEAEARLVVDGLRDRWRIQPEEG